MAVVEDCLRRPANCVARFDSRLIKPGDLLLKATASLIALWLDLRVTMDSGSSKGGGKLGIAAAETVRRRLDGRVVRRELG
jgi:hypothetical protein